MVIHSQSPEHMTHAKWEPEEGMRCGVIYKPKMEEDAYTRCCYNNYLSSTDWSLGLIRSSMEIAGTLNEDCTVFFLNMAL